MTTFSIKDECPAENIIDDLSPEYIQRENTKRMVGFISDLLKRVKALEDWKASLPEYPSIAPGDTHRPETGSGGKLPTS
jgi:hypothetical protein